MTLKGKAHDPTSHVKSRAISKFSIVFHARVIARNIARNIFEVE